MSADFKTIVVLRNSAGIQIGMQLLGLIISDSSLQTWAHSTTMASAFCPVAMIVCYMVWLLSRINGPQVTYEHLSSFSLRDGERYDFIIVGGGSAGCVVAGR
jgi:hypothetical protein